MVAKTANVLARDEMDTAAFYNMMEKGLAQAKAGQGFPLGEAFSLLYKAYDMGKEDEVRIET